MKALQTGSDRMREGTVVSLSKYPLPLLLFLALFGTLSVGCTAGSDSDGGVQLLILSSRPDMVTGGDALVRVVLPGSLAGADVSVGVNGRDATASFRPDPDGGGLLGVITGLELGSNVVSVVAPGGRSVTLEVTNHPTSGPVFSGPHQTPFICETDAFQMVSGELLGPSLDDDCSAARRVVHVYRSTDGSLKPLPEEGTYPADLVRTVTSLGVEVPYIVRVETGTVNRSIYELAILHDPRIEPDPDPWIRPEGWNHRVIARLGGGCPGGWYRQGNRTGGVTDDMMLRQGYAIISSSLNVFGINCNDLTSSETLMMVKERFIVAFGPPLFTVGWGSSGGSYQSHQTADNYPGIIDGAIVGGSYPEVMVATTTLNSDARLLHHYFTNTAQVPFTDEEKRLVSGLTYLDILTVLAVQHASRINPVEVCPDVLPQAMRYHPTDNPSGVRCDMYTHMENVLGRDPETGLVRRPLDNVGIQYGLGALNRGEISRQQFLDLNGRIGGYDADANFVAQRTEGDPLAIRAIYETGRFLDGSAGMVSTPLIDYRAYVDERPGGDVHPRFHSFSTEARLLQANGHVDNRVMLTEDMRHGGFSSSSPVLQEALAQMDLWLTGIKEDASDASPLEKLRRHRPADLVDACWSRDDTPVKIVEKQTRDPESVCAQLYPPGSFPREVAGGPLAVDIQKCQLKPLDLADYAVDFTEDEVALLRDIFPDGVCDWTVAGVEQRPLLGTWQVFPTSLN